MKTFALSLAIGASVVALSSCGDKQEAKTKAEPQKTAPMETKASELQTNRPAPNPNKNAYYGDLHVHTSNSFDASIFGTKATPDDAYRFAKGEAIDNGTKTMIKLDGPPLDFFAVTDHGEYMGVVKSMMDRGSKLSKTKTAKSIFGLLATDRREHFINIGTTIVTGDPIEDINDRDFMDSVWAETVAAAERHNEPGVFTTFAGYEYTAMELLGANGLPDPTATIDTSPGAANLHRNVIFKGDAPTRLFTNHDSTNPEDLWDWMNDQRAAGRESMAIPHNSNVSNGLMFTRTRHDYKTKMSANYARNRLLNEPIAEISQVKGTSETHPSLSPNDEWADHEPYDFLLGGNTLAEQKPGSYLRQTLAMGIDMESDIGVNPYELGFIGSSDSHVAGPSVSEEHHFGKFSNDTKREQRQSTPPKGADAWPEDYKESFDLLASRYYAASGLAGVWAPENTREALFAGMQAKETFGTSGPRIQVRMFASDNFSDGILNAADMVAQAYAQGVPMGASLNGGESAPEILAWAMQDPNATPLQRLQVIKVWYAGGTEREAVFDVACAGGAAVNAQTNRCPDNGATVDLTTCATNDETGSAELKAVWQDPSYVAGQDAAYYVRVLENPKCRWSTWDAVRNGTPPNPTIAATLQDRAWGTAIWVKG